MFMRKTPVRGNPHQNGDQQREAGAKASQLWSDAFGTAATRAVQVIVLIAVLVGVIWGLRMLSTVAIPIMLALILACTFHPVMRWLRNHRVPSVLATIIVLLGTVLILTGLGALVAWAVADQWADLEKQATDGFDQIVKMVHQLPYAPSADQISEWKDTATSFLTSSQFGSGAIAGVSAVTSMITGLVLMVVILFFFLKDGPQIWQFLCRPFRGEAAARADRVADKTVRTLGSYVRGTATVAAVDAIGIGIGLLVLQVPLAIPLAVLVFLLAFIPIVGAVLAGIFAALVALVSNGLVSALLVVAVIILVNQLEGNLLQPVLMGRALKLHSLAILLALTIGTVTGGVLGAVLAVPIAAVVWGIIQVWDGPNLPVRWARPNAVERK
jgi:predicted PurR-regulated permease PerM